MLSTAQNYLSRKRQKLVMHSWGSLKHYWKSIEKIKGVVMQIAEVNIQLVKPNDGLLAFASVVISNQLYVSGIAVHQRFDGQGYRITYPTRKNGDKQFHIFHPIERGLSAAIESAVISKMKDVMSKNNDRKQI